MSDPEATHVEGVASTRAALARIGVSESDEVRLDDDPASGSPRLVSRLSFTVEDGVVGSALLVTTPGSGCALDSTSLGTWFSPEEVDPREEVVLGVTASGWRVLTLLRTTRRTRFESATNAEVTRARELLDSLDPGAALEVRRAVSDLALRRGAFHLGEFETGERSYVLAATAVLTDLASGTPLEWALHRAEAGDR